MDIVGAMQSWAESNYKKKTGNSYKNDLRDFIWEYERMTDIQLKRERERVYDSAGSFQKPVRLEALETVRKQRGIRSWDWI